MAIDAEKARQQPTSRLQAFDLIRLVAVAYVISLRHIPNYLAHGRAGALDTMVTYLLLGWLVFISGYVLARRYPQLRGRENVWHFLVRRLLRVYPLYVIAVFGYVVYDRSLTLVNVVAHLLSLNLVLTPATGVPLRTVWFVSMIILYYFAYVGFVRIRDAVLVAVAAAATLALLAVNTWAGYTDKRLALFLPLFAAGIVVARSLLLTRRRTTAVLISSVTFMLLGALYLAWPGLPSLSAMLLFILWILSGILPVWTAASWLVQKLGWGKLAGGLCYASFCTYLFHRHVYRILLLIYRPPGGVGTVLYLALFGVPVAYLVGFLVQAGYDRVLSRLKLG